MVRTSQILEKVKQAGTGEVPAPTEWRSDAPVPLLRNVLRLTAPNPGVMTGPGTNSYLVGEPQTGFIVIDPGPADHDHLHRLWQAAQHPDGSPGNIHSIVCTHSHPDHSPGAAPLQALCSAAPPILGLPSASTARAASEFTPDQVLPDSAVLHLALPAEKNADSAETAEGTNATGERSGHTLKVIHTPGHAANHVCLLLMEDGLLFSGDHILNGSTTVIDPPDGNMMDYLDSLERLHRECSIHAARYILPAHGHVITDALGAISHLQAHRLQREAKILKVMQANPQGSLDQWLPLAYDDVDPRIWPVARRSLLAHVERIEALQQRDRQRAQDAM